jgi:DNA repair protein RadC
MDLFSNLNPDAEVLHTNKLCELQVKYTRNRDAEPKQAIRGSSDCFRYFHQLFSEELGIIDHREAFAILLLDRANNIICHYVVSIGGIAGTVADPKIIFQAALLANASAMILCHNHPSGNKTPSQADRTITAKLVNAGRALDLPVLDHIILVEHGYYSFSDEGDLH